jgi:hypothetical protein
MSKIRQSILIFYARPIAQHKEGNAKTKIPAAGLKTKVEFNIKI